MATFFDLVGTTPESVPTLKTITSSTTINSDPVPVPAGAAAGDLVLAIATNRTAPQTPWIMVPPLLDSLVNLTSYGVGPFGYEPGLYIWAGRLPNPMPTHIEFGGAALSGNSQQALILIEGRTNITVSDPKSGYGLDPTFYNVSTNGQLTTAFAIVGLLGVNEGVLAPPLGFKEIVNDAADTWLSLSVSMDTTLSSPTVVGPATLALNNNWTTVVIGCTSNYAGAYSGPVPTIEVPHRVPLGSDFTITGKTIYPASLQLQSSPDGTTWTNSGSPSASGLQHSWTINAQVSTPTHWRVSVVGALTPKIANGAFPIIFETARTTGLPTSSNAASSFHLYFDGCPIDLVTTATIDLTISTPGADPSFWAFQTDFINGSGAIVGAAHLGLQIWPGYPSSKAVNWGGYNTATGAELFGSASALPSDTGNQNTRNFLWVTGEKYRLTITKADYGVWTGSVTRISNGAVTVVRDLFVPDGVYIGKSILCWNENFSTCNAASKTALWQRPRVSNLFGGSWQPKIGTVTYQTHADGGCTNSNWSTAGGGIGWNQSSGVARTVHQGQKLIAMNTQA